MTIIHYVFCFETRVWNTVKFTKKIAKGNENNLILLKTVCVHLERPDRVCVYIVSSMFVLRYISLR